MTASAPPELPPLRARSTVLLAIGYLAAYVALDRMAKWFLTSHQASLWYPPAALSLTLAIVGGRRFAWLLVLGPPTAAWAKGTLHLHPLRSVLLGVVVAVAYGAAGGLIRRRFDNDLRQGSVRDSGLIIGAGILGPLLAAALGGVVFCATRADPWSAYWSVLRDFFLGDMVGVLTFAPALLLAMPGLVRVRTWTRPSPPLVVEVVLQSAVLVLGAYAAFGTPAAPAIGAPLSDSLPGVNRVYLCLPILIWIGLRHGLRGSVPAALAMTILSMSFGHDKITTQAELIDFQAFLALVAITGMLLGSLTDRQRATAEEHARQTIHDALTGLPNRSLFSDRLWHALARDPSDQPALAVLILGLDRFAHINDELGFDGGDRVLRTVAWRLTTGVHAGDSVARLHGDHFAILLQSAASTLEAVSTVDHLQRALEAPLTIDGRRVFLTSSAGIVTAAPGTSNPAQLLREAEIALRRAKSAGGRRFEVFDEALNTVARRRVAVEADLRTALETDGLRMHYQPIVELATQRVSGFEALLRWPHDVHGSVPIIDVIEIAEQCGLSRALGKWVLSAVCVQAAAWESDYGATAPVLSINITPRQLQDPVFLSDVYGAIRESGVSANLLAIEITEGSLIGDVEVARSVLRALRDTGIKVLVDDFGTGYSSLAYLSSLPLDTLKIDRSFVDALATDPHATAIVTAIIGMAASLDLAVVAEGVETEQQLQQLRALGCGWVQGYLISRPLPAAEAARHLTVPA